MRHFKTAPWRLDLLVQSLGLRVFILYYMIQCYTILYYIILYYTRIYNVIIYYTTFYYIIVSYTILD